MRTRQKASRCWSRTVLAVWLAAALGLAISCASAPMAPQSSGQATPEPAHKPEAEWVRPDAPVAADKGIQVFNLATLVAT
jgi:hypothetical protein